MTRDIWVVKLASRQQMLNLPLELLVTSSGYSETPDSSCDLFYRDAVAACKVATSAGGIVLLRQSDEDMLLTQPPEMVLPTVTISR